MDRQHSLIFGFYLLALWALLRGMMAENVALGKPAIQLGTWMDDVAERAVDGDLRQELTEGACAHPYSLDDTLDPGLRGTPTWWSVDLTAGDNTTRFLIQNVTIYYRTGCCPDRNIDNLILVGNSSDIDTHTECARTTVDVSMQTLDCMPDGPIAYLTIRHLTSSSLTLCEVIVEGCQYQEWTAWTNVGGCSTTCGGGQRTRTRSCEGCPCDEQDQEIMPCSEEPCPIDGGWSEWITWDICSTTCGGGVQSRTRTCDSPTPQNNGAPCDGPDEETRACSEQACPIDGGWSTWTPWSDCSTSCGNGEQNRGRVCDDPTPENGGAPCDGPDGEIGICSQEPCLPGNNTTLFAIIGLVVGVVMLLLAGMGICIVFDVNSKASLDISRAAVQQPPPFRRGIRFNARPSYRPSN